MYTVLMGTNITPENIIIDFIKADASAGENWADVNLSAFAAACRAAGMAVTESLDADDYDETCDCGDVIHGFKAYRVYATGDIVCAE